MDPVATLRAYIERTRYQRSDKKPLFLSLKPLFGAISAKTVGRVSSKAIKLVGLEELSYNAKSFCLTGATMAVQAGLIPDSIRKIDRWKCSETFENHHVHAQPVEEFTDKILGLNE